MPDSALGIIVGEYFGDMKDPVGIRDAFLELMGDLLIVVPGIEEARRCRGEEYTGNYTNLMPDFSLETSWKTLFNHYYE